MKKLNKKIVAIGASSSRQSINKQFANFAAHQVPEAEVTLLDLNDYEMPIYSIDREREEGIPKLAYDFKEQLLEADGLVISFAEHNGVYTAAFKNIFDWISRIKGSTFGDKPMLLLATSPGKRGGKTILEIAVKRFAFMNKGSIASFSLPSFRENFSQETGIRDPHLKQDFQTQLQKFIQAIEDELTQVANVSSV